MRLDQDDIKAIQALYGKKLLETTSNPTTTSFTGSLATGTETTGTPATGTEPPILIHPYSNTSLCSDPSIDIIFQTAAGTSYVFRGESYWKLTSESIAEGYPRRIVDDWKGLPNYIDAAFTWQGTKSTYFFKGGNYWKF